MPHRSVAIDALKGILVIMMVVYHACYIAVMFKLVRLELYQGFWWLFPRMTAAGFVTVSGWNLAGKKARGARFLDYAKRAGRLGIVAVLISAVTWPVFGKGFVFFGIIHLLAVSTILAYPFLGRPPLAIATAAACTAAGLALGTARFGFPWLAWLGFRPASLHPVDYLPLLPWFAFALSGAAAHDIARRVIAHRLGAKVAPHTEPARAVSMLAAIGKRSLAVYLSHLPLLYGLGWILSLIAAEV
jgi:uncharacterized membrane protein